MAARIRKDMAIFPHDRNFMVLPDYLTRTGKKQEHLPDYVMGHINPKRKRGLVDAPDAKHVRFRK
jgi:hypothetical protein